MHVLHPSYFDFCLTTSAIPAQWMARMKLNCVNQASDSMPMLRWRENNWWMTKFWLTLQYLYGKTVGVSWTCRFYHLHSGKTLHSSQDIKISMMSRAGHDMMVINEINFTSIMVISCEHIYAISEVSILSKTTSHQSSRWQAVNSVFRPHTQKKQYNRWCSPLSWSLERQK